MKPRVWATILSLSVFMSGLLFAQSAKEMPTNQMKRSLAFQEGLRFSYDGKHTEAQKVFESCLNDHPNDLLCTLRLVYDRFFQNRKDGGKLSPAEYQWELGKLNAAIAEYETRQCTDTDLAVTGNTVDCGYVGAALYSLRMTLRGENEGWFKARVLIGKDRNSFLDAAKRSKSQQTHFLLGVYEYAPSEQSGFKKRLGIFLAGVPHDRAHASATIIASLEGNSSPFVDDIRFFILDAERKHTKPGDESGFEERFPLAQIVRDLRDRYQENPKLQSY